MSKYFEDGKSVITQLTKTILVMSSDWQQSVLVLVQKKKQESVHTDGMKLLVGIF